MGLGVPSEASPGESEGAELAEPLQPTRCDEVLVLSTPEAEDDVVATLLG